MELIPKTDKDGNILFDEDVIVILTKTDRRVAKEIYGPAHEQKCEEQRRRQGRPPLPEWLRHRRFRRQSSPEVLALEREIIKEFRRSRKRIHRQMRLPR